jgi:hypothetical protein
VAERKKEEERKLYFATNRRHNLKLRGNKDQKPINPGLHPEDAVYNGIKYHILAKFKYL